MGTVAPPPGDATPGSVGTLPAPWARCRVARVLLLASGRQPAVWLAAVAAIGGLGGLATVGDEARPELLGAACAVGGVAGTAAIGAADAGPWIAVRLVWPGIGLAVAALLTGRGVSAVEAGIGLATAAGVAAGLRRYAAEAADALTATLVAVALVSLAAWGGAVAGHRAGWAVGLSALAGLALPTAVVYGRPRLEPWFDPPPWTAPPERTIPWPTDTRFRQRLVAVAMVVSLVAMVTGLFLVPAAAPAVAVVASGLIIVLALPPACLRHGGSRDRRWCWLERAAVRAADPAGTWWPARLPAGAREAARGIAWHAAVVGWPACVAVALSAGEPQRLQGALGVLLAVAVAAGGVAAAAYAGGRSTPGVIEGETAQAVGLAIAAGALVAAVSWG